MKFLITVIIATAIALTNADPLDPYETLAAECAAHEGATDDDIKQALALEMPSTKAGKCLNACIGETTGVVSTISPHITTIRINITNLLIYSRYFHDPWNWL